MSESRPPVDLPPTPKGLSQQMNSEVIPFKSTKINIKKSPLLFAVVAIAVMTFLMFNQLSGFQQSGSTAPIFMFVLVAIAAILVSMFAFMYIYSKSNKPLWAFVFPVALLYAILMTPLSRPFFMIFREILPGNFKPEMNVSVAQTFIAMLFGAGLMEELMKACPALIGAWLSIKSAQWKPKLPPALYEGLRVRGPLDGLLIGVAAGAMFIFLETGMQYSGGAILKTTDPVAIIGSLMLMVPRTMGGVIGHMAWAGITGYFIGLCVLRPHLPKIYLLWAWLAASVLHATWNTVGAGGLGSLPMYVSAIATVVLFVSCFLKARQLDQKSGASLETYGSIVVDINEVAAKARANAGVGAANAPSVSAAARSASAGAQHWQQAPNAQGFPAAAVSADAAHADNFVLRLDGVNFELRAGQSVDFKARLPGLPGLAADVTTHPTNPSLLGLRNLGAVAWKVTMPNLSIQSVEAQRNVRLVAGMRIEFSPGTTGHIAAAS